MVICRSFLGPPLRENSELWPVFVRRYFTSSISFTFFPERSTESRGPSPPTMRISPERTCMRKCTPMAMGASKCALPLSENSVLSAARVGRAKRAREQREVIRVFMDRPPRRALLQKDTLNGRKCSMFCWDGSRGTLFCPRPALHCGNEREPAIRESGRRKARTKARILHHRVERRRRSRRHRGRSLGGEHFARGFWNGQLYRGCVRFCPPLENVGRRGRAAACFPREAGPSFGRFVFCSIGRLRCI